MLTRQDKQLMKQNTEAMWTQMEHSREVATLLFGDPLHSHVEILEEINRLKAQNGN